MFDRLIRLIGEDNLKKIQSKKILLIGVGGVGSASLEALVRNGFTNIDIIDYDTVDITNLNRQLITNQNNIGSPKVKEAVLRAKSINPDILIKKIEKRLEIDLIDELLSNNYDYIIDACDDIKIKYSLIEKNLHCNSKLITCLGTAKKIDPTLLEITTLDKTINDPLARILRKMTKDNHINQKKVKVVSSRELPRKTEGLGTASFVPNTAGFLCVNYIFKDIIND
ncbi:MAG: ThiF family adenylyltransferase [Bacilli bacterium]|nr:ThiF family adenylyltransferase [Bacilli bacterium]